MKFTTEEFIIKARQTHGDFYSYDKTNYIKSSEKVTITCPIHGDFQQQANSHLRGINCPLCSNKRRSLNKSLSTYEFVEKAKQIHGDKYDYSKVEYVKSLIPVIITCNIHGDFQQIPNNHLRSEGCPKCGNIKIGLKLKYTTKDFIEKAKQVHGDKYDYSKVEYGKDNKSKIIITCPIHGDFEQEAKSHLQGTGCLKCGYDYTSKLFTQTKEDFVEKAKQVHGDKYDYSKVEYVKSQSKVTITCPEHGDFDQNPDNHLLGKGCVECGRIKTIESVKLTPEEFIEKAHQVHNGKYSYENTNYVYSKDKVSITCPIHGYFQQEAQSHLQGYGCPKCSSIISKGEQEVVDYIKSIIPNEIITSHRPDFMYGMELDIYIPEFNLAIEYDGLYYHNELFREKDYHLEKTVLCEKSGVHLIHLFEDEWTYKKDIVKSRLRNLFHLNTTKLYARKCKIVDLTMYRDVVNQFLTNNHIQGKTNFLFAYGLMSDIKGIDTVVSVMTFNKPSVFSGSNKIEPGSFELSRFCSIVDYNVCGGASRLLAHFIKLYDPQLIVSYADRRWSSSNSNVYQKLGFPNQFINEPDYSYIVGDRRKHRSSFTKHKLVEKYGCKPEDTEKNFCFENGFYRIYDCGKITYKLLRL